MARASNVTARRFALAQLVLALVCLLPLGCATTWLEGFDHEQSMHCRIDNPDRDNLWDTSDTNGNGVIDDDEHAGVVFDLNSGTASSSTFSRPTPASRSFGGPGRTLFPSTAGYTVYESGVLIANSSTSADGIPDDLNSSFSSFGFVFIDANANGTFDPVNVLRSGIDFDDLHTFNIAFDQVRVTPYTETYGMQLSQTHRFSTPIGKTEPNPRPSHVEVSFGARYLRLQESIFFRGTGGILGVTTLDATFDNELVGPQIAIGWSKQQFGWDIELGSTAMVGYDLSNGNQSGSIGQDLTPGAVNRPATARPNLVFHEQDKDEFSSIGEIRAQAAYPLSQSSTLRLGYTALYISHIRHVDNSIDWSLPNFGFLDASTQDTWLSGLHASVEWRR